MEYITSWSSRMGEWFSLLPWVLIQYLVIILIFVFFFYFAKVSQKKVFLTMLVVMYGFEFLWQNPLLFSVDSFLWASALLIFIWSILTFVPYWIAERV